MTNYKYKYLKYKMKYLKYTKNLLSGGADDIKELKGKLIKCKEEKNELQHKLTKCEQEKNELQGKLNDGTSRQTHAEDPGPRHTGSPSGQGREGTNPEEVRFNIAAERYGRGESEEAIEYSFHPFR